MGEWRGQLSFLQQSAANHRHHRLINNNHHLRSTTTTTGRSAIDLQDGRVQQAEEVRLKKTVKAAKWKMAEDGEGGMEMEDEGGVWGWKSPEDGGAAQSSAHPCPPCNW